MESVGSCQSYDTSSSSSSEESKLPESDVSCISSDVEGTFADDPDCIKSGSPDPSCLPKCSTSRQRERRLRRDVVRKRGGSKTVRFDIDMNHRRANRMVEAIPESSATPAESQAGDRLPDEHNFRQAEKLAGKSSSHLFARCVHISRPFGLTRGETQSTTLAATRPSFYHANTEDTETKTQVRNTKWQSLDRS